MSKISTGIRDLDGLIDSLYIGDNVIWEIEAGTSSEAFLKGFIRQSISEGQNILYISFNKSPQSILHQLGELPRSGFTLLDCFTSGKGKNDKTFIKFYESGSMKNVSRIESPADISAFSNILNSIEDSLPPGARYIFDSLTGMQDLWGKEEATYKFFTYMCPRLYDLGTVAYWVLEKEAHSQTFKANLRHVTQAVLELYKRKDSLYIKAHKLEGRQSREPFKPHPYRIEDRDIFISQLKKEPLLDIGSKIKEIRTRLGLSQKEIADRIDLTPSFISQLENNQISPSLNSFIHICNALGTSPDEIWKDLRAGEPSWVIRREKILSGASFSVNGLKGFDIIKSGDMSGSLSVLEPGSSHSGRLTTHTGKEFVYVLKGNVSVTLTGRRELLMEGDSIFLRDERPSLWKNEGGDKAELLVVSL
ncbi:MAG: helix-turn-helix domain-containing protein [Thermodesulfovibrionales bacterium]|nr:helix-turn-helix domain-containing protein [Thermodesulfovibrionales bacterium]